MRTFPMSRFPRLVCLIALAAVLWAVPAGAGGTQPTFATPEEAFQALLAASKDNDIPRLLSLLGPGSRPLIESGDPVADVTGRESFMQAAAERTFYQRSGDAKVFVNVGYDNWPLPIPIVKKDGKWRFDAAAGLQEMLDRRVGRNELEALKTLKAMVDAEHKFYQGDLDGNGVRDYAAKVMAPAGTRRGLYWASKPGQPESPLGPLVADAMSEGYGVPNSPYHGYYFKILKEQGPHARGGAFRYAQNGNLVAGFAIVAWPAEHGVSGLTSFLVNANGVVWEKNLGADSDAICRAMTAYDPDRTWKRAK